MLISQNRGVGCLQRKTELASFLLFFHTWPLMAHISLIVRYNIFWLLSTSVFSVLLWVLTYAWFMPECSHHNYNQGYKKKKERKKKKMCVLVQRWFSEHVWLVGKFNLLLHQLQTLLRDGCAHFHMCVVFFSTLNRLTLTPKAPSVHFLP